MKNACFIFLTYNFSLTHEMIFLVILVVVEKNSRALLFQIAFEIIRSAELN